MNWYNLVDRIPVIVTDIRKIVKEAPIGSDAVKVLDYLMTVSTIFLNMDHNIMLGGSPVLFETMIFGEPFDGFQYRYNTIDQAEAGHKIILEYAKGNISQEEMYKMLDKL